ncbi:MAG: pentapeptide repeat-containing protein [Campylobacteraceae bacterium]|nr:pentapeptide repeat-containing protein [Campylobacteraceae bacterium]
MSIEKKSIPYPNTNTAIENETFLKWCFNNGADGKDVWSTFAYKSQQSEPINLIGSSLEELNLQGIYLSGVKLGGANLSKTNLGSANLFEANLVGANLTQTNLSHANLNEADFFKANLTNTNFTNAYLKNAYFKGAILADTIFEKADLEGTHLDLKKDALSDSIPQETSKQEISTPEPINDEVKMTVHDKEFIINKQTSTSSIKQEISKKTRQENSGSEIHGSVELRGSIFHKNIDLRDINFFTNKISNILRHTFNATNTSKLLKNNFNISLGTIEENMLNLNLNLDFGIKLPPLLLNRQMQIWNIASVVIDTLKKLGENFNNEEPLKIANTDTIKDDIIISNDQGKEFLIENYIYKIIHNTLDDIQDLNEKIHDNQLDYIILNDKKLMSRDSVEHIHKGIDIFNKIKEHHIKDTFQAQIEVFEFNTLTKNGKAIIYQANYKNATIFEETEFELENESIEKILHSMNKNTILVNFRPIIENYGNNKVVKKMILTL